MASSRFDFPGSQGSMLSARLDAPDSPPRGWAVFAHCFTCNKDARAAVYVARALVRRGFGVLRFDFTGLGGSGGEFANTNFSSNVDDLVAAAEWLRSQRGAPALLLGHSFGGAAVLAAAHRVHDCRAVATLGAPFEPAHVVRQLGQHLDTIREHGRASVALAGRTFTISQAFLEDLDGATQEGRIRTLRRPLLVLHSPQDDTVDIDNARRIFEAARHPKSFLALDEADHLLTRERDARFAAEVIAAWALRYVAPEGNDKMCEPPSARAAAQ